MIDLLHYWDTYYPPANEQRIHALQQQPSGYIRTINDSFIQASVEFTKPVQVRIVKDLQTLTPHLSYQSLPTVPLTTEEALAVEKRKKILEKNPTFYDGNQIVLTGITYDQETATIYLEAKQTKFSVLNTLSTHTFPEGSPIYNFQLYKTGVIAPFITNDNHVFLMQRNDPYKLYSAAAGFLEGLGDLGQINYFTHGDLVTHTAKTEALEEFLYSEKKEARTIMEEAVITSVSFRKANTEMGTIEFIAPIQLRCSKKELQAILNTNEAPDKKEHTGEYLSFSLDPKERTALYDFFKHNPLPGEFLITPSIRGAFRFNDKLNTQNIIPGLRGHAIPIETLLPKTQTTESEGATPPHSM